MIVPTRGGFTRACSYGSIVILSVSKLCCNTNLRVSPGDEHGTHYMEWLSCRHQQWREHLRRRHKLRCLHPDYRRLTKRLHQQICQRER